MNASASWSTLHEASSDLAHEAGIALHRSDTVEARRLHLEAAAKEAEAYLAIEGDKPRTRGITAVSLVCLFLKGGDRGSAEAWVVRLLDDPDLPEWATADLRACLAED
jgi:hypothetical protein